MASALAEVAGRFTAEDLVADLQTAFVAASLGSPLVVPRRKLEQAARYPALAFELGAFETRSVGAGGLRAMVGEGVWWLAMAADDETLLLTRLRTATDLVRQTVEAALAGEFQRCECSAAAPEGEVARQAGLTLRLVPVRFTYHWLYQSGVL